MESECGRTVDGIRSEVGEVGSTVGSAEGGTG